MISWLVWSLPLATLCAMYNTSITGTLSLRCCKAQGKAVSVRFIVNLPPEQDCTATAFDMWGAGLVMINGEFTRKFMCSYLITSTNYFILVI